MKRDEKTESLDSVGAWFIRAWARYPFRMLGLNCLFLIACIPIITIPAAYCGLHAIVQKTYRRIYTTEVVKDFFKEFKEAFFQRLLLTLSVIAVPMMISIALMNKVDAIIWYGITATLVVMMLIVLSWFFPQLVFMTLKPGQALKNALIFMTMNSWKNFFLVMIWTICLTIIVWGWPLSGFLLVFLPVLQVILITGITMPTLYEYLLKDNCENKTEE